MKILISCFMVFNLFLMAAELPNTGLQQNSLGYYGEGVTYGGYPIVGSWKMCTRTEEMIFDNNGSMISGSADPLTYGVSEDGQILYIDAVEVEETYTILENGNNGCLYINAHLRDLNFGVTFDNECIVCTSSIGSKTYGPNSNVLNITVGVD